MMLFVLLYVGVVEIGSAIVGAQHGKNSSCEYKRSQHNKKREVAFRVRYGLLRLWAR